MINETKIIILHKEIFISVLKMNGFNKDEFLEYHSLDIIILLGLPSALKLGKHTLHNNILVLCSKQIK